MYLCILPFNFHSKKINNVSTRQKHLYSNVFLFLSHSSLRAFIQISFVVSNGIPNGGVYVYFMEMLGN